MPTIFPILNTNNIIDTLVSTSIVDTLSANQGKVLDDKITPLIGIPDFGILDPGLRITNAQIHDNDCYTLFWNVIDGAGTLWFRMTAKVDGEFSFISMTTRSGSTPREFAADQVVTASSQHWLSDSPASPPSGTEVFQDDQMNGYVASVIFKPDSGDRCLFLYNGSAYVETVAANTSHLALKIEQNTAIS